MSRGLMFQGTGSNVGKSVLVAGLCRLARHRGLEVRPFKPQNMSNNAAVAQGDDGSSGEIGRAQWLQALACGVPPHVDMNPVLLKPQSESGSQIIVNGKVFGSSGARDYQKLRSQLLEPVLDSYNRLKNKSDLVLVEGAGSPAEINLRQHDIANMGFALAARVPVVLIGDIDRGGVIASLVGTHTILDPDDRAQIKGFIINKFRGDASLFDEGREQITSFTRWRDFGLLPWLEVVGRLPEEDSVWFSQQDKISSDGDHQQAGRIKVAVPVFSRIANFDDLDPLKSENDVELIFVRPGMDIPEDSDLVILAGSKSTIGDMAELWERGWAKQIQELAVRHCSIIGICGGYQMLGGIIRDPLNIEGQVSEIEGLGLLDVETVLEGRKTVGLSKGMSREFDVPVEGYEIHLGATTGGDCVRPMIELTGRSQGAVSTDGRIRGCYLHGIFGNDAYRAQLIRSLGGQSEAGSYIEQVEQALDELAHELEKHIEIDDLFALAS